MATQRKARAQTPGRQAGDIAADYVFRELSPTAQRILAAAQRVLERDGFSGVTLQRVAAEAGEHKSLVLYHFGNKATLMTMLVDSLWHDLDVDLFQSVEKLPMMSTGRISALIDAQRQLGHLVPQQQMYMELFAGVTRRADMRRHLAGLNRSYRDLHRSCLAAAGLRDDDLAALAALVLAIGDGMAVSLLVRPREIDDVAVYRLLEDMVFSLTSGVLGEAVAPAAQPRGTERLASACPPPVPGPALGATLGPDPAADLPPVARKLLRGARTVLRRRGFHALTLEAVGREAGEPPSSITYYFGDKQGLITALIDAQFHEQHKIAARILGGNGDRCPLQAACATRELLSDLTSFRVFFDLLPVVTREPRFLAQQAAHDRWLEDLISAGLAGSGQADVATQAGALAVLEIAAADGLAMQLLCDPSGFDAEPSCRMLERLIGRHVPAPTEAPGGASHD